MNKEINGPILFCVWYITDSMGEKTVQDNQEKIEAISRLVVFLIMFLLEHLVKIIVHIHVRLVAQG